MRCPYCQSDIEADSHFCDQCGKALMYCPSCKVAKKGSSCPKCGETLVSADEYFSGGSTISDKDMAEIFNKAFKDTLFPKKTAGESSKSRLLIRSKDGSWQSEWSDGPINLKFSDGSKKKVGEIKWFEKSREWSIASNGLDSTMALTGINIPCGDYVGQMGLFYHIDSGNSFILGGREYIFEIK